MATEPQLPPELIKELATAAIAKRKQATKRTMGMGGVTRIVPRISERQKLELTKALSDFYGFAAVPRTNKEHREMAEIVVESWVPLTEYERQVLYKDEAQAMVEELKRDNAALRKRLEEALKEVPRYKAVIRASVARLVVDQQEKHVKEEWAVVLLRRLEAARQILLAELEPGSPGEQAEA